MTTTDDDSRRPEQAPAPEASGAASADVREQEAAAASRTDGRPPDPVWDAEDVPNHPPAVAGMAGEPPVALVDAPPAAPGPAAPAPVGSTPVADGAVQGNGQPPGGPARAPQPPAPPGSPSGPRTPETRDAAVVWARWWQPELPLAGEPRRPWREQVRIGAAEMSRLAIWMGGRTDGVSTPGNGLLADADIDVAIHDLLQTADEAARGRSFWPAERRARMERAFAALDAAETTLLRRAPECYLRGRESALRAHVTAHLPPEHPQRVEVERLRLASSGTPLGDVQREILASANQAASNAARREHARLRSFRSVIALTTVALAALAVTFAVVSAARPAWMPLCFAPAGVDAVVCPTSTAPLGAGAADTGGDGANADGTATDATALSAAEVSEVIGSTAAAPDAALVMLLGLGAAAVTGAAALRRMRGTSTPFAVPVALLALKLPTGALTAFFGLLLIHGQIVPGLSALDSSGQILAWALLFGAAQQLVTGLVDKKAQSVLDSVGPAPMTADRE